MSHRYYASMHGSWRGVLRLVVTDQAAMCHLRLTERLLARLSALLFRVSGGLRMDTTLDYHSRGAEGEVTHTTRVSWLGVPLLGSVERIHLHADGVTGTMDGDEWMAPWPWPSARAPGPVTVHADAHGADYDLRWLGGPLRQETRSAEAGQLTLVQTTAWSRAEVDLRRRPGVKTGGSRPETGGQRIPYSRFS